MNTMNACETNNDGLYRGDVFLDTLQSHLKATGIASKWQKVCEKELGFPHGEVSEAPIRRMEPFWRLFGTVVHARIEFLSDFDAAVAVDDANRSFLRRLQTSSKSRRRDIFSVPEDILVFLVLRNGGALLTRRYIREVVQFDPCIGEAIIDCLNVPE